MFKEKLKKFVQESINQIAAACFVAGMIILLIVVLSGDKDMGFAPSSGYTPSVTVYLDDSATTINVSKVTDDDGIELALSSSNKGYFTIDPGQTDAERIVCTGVSGNTLTGCTRGLAASGRSETGSSTLAEAHDVGSLVIMTNISQFFNNYLNIWDDQTVAGTKTFTDFPIIPTATSTVSSYAAANKEYVDNVAIAGSPDATVSVKGIVEITHAYELGFGEEFGSTGATLVLANENASRDYNGEEVIMIAEEDGRMSQTFLDLTEDFTFSGDTTFSGSTSFSDAVVNFSDSSDGDVTISSTVTLTEDMNYKTLTIESGGILKPNGYKIFAITIDIQSGGEIQANGGDASGRILGAVAHSNGTLLSSVPGETGPLADGSSHAGITGDAATYSLGVVGVSGGNGGDYDGNTGGVKGGHGSLSAKTRDITNVKNFLNFVDLNFSSGNTYVFYEGTTGSGSGGTGAPDGSNLGGSGGGSGAPGGFIYIVAKQLIVNGTISASGGIGGDGEDMGSISSDTSGGGAGGAGSGGVLLLLTETLSGTGAISVIGGDGGNGGDGGTYSSWTLVDGGDGGDAGNGGNLYKLYETDTSSITLGVNAGSAGVGGAAGSGGAPGSDGSAGSVGTVTSIQYNN